MKVKELIEKLSKQNPDLQVMIEQGEEFDYTAAQFVREKEVISEEDEEPTTVVVIDYC
jgi:hypothetical protein